eukprot:362822-Chlamydomonas_euryale.AAC.38
MMPRAAPCKVTCDFEGVIQRFNQCIPSWDAYCEGAEGRATCVRELFVAQHAAQGDGHDLAEPLSRLHPQQHILCAHPHHLHFTDNFGRSPFVPCFKTSPSQMSHMPPQAP